MISFTEDGNERPDRIAALIFFLSFAGQAVSLDS